MDNAKYIVVEGPIGVGKTSLVHMLADRFEARTVLEKYERNPFLPDFYHDRERYAFQTQMFFLLSRYQQQCEFIQMDMFKQSVISDYLFTKDKIFAQLNLSEDELALYNKMHDLMDTKIPKPDLVIFLQAKIDVLLDRIKHRNHKYEKGITSDYLEDLLKAYSDFFFYYSDSPLLIINTSEIDFVNRPEDFENLVKEILEARRGTQYFAPMSSLDEPDTG
jgi:deoxyadenosine/deoxycytidine kinase